jgi:filamentous hemagglutinin family protein
LAFAAKSSAYRETAMNRTYRLVWNESCRSFVAVAEFVKRRGQRGAVVAMLALTGVPVWALDANALPTGGQVSAGAATISQAANQMTITQSTQRAVLDWQSFNIGASATVNFVQPNSSAVALNRIAGNSASEIYGKLTANGHVFFINPNGMLFGRGAEVNVGGILASTLNIGNADFMTGNHRFNSPGSGSIRNEGLINASGGVVLAGQAVENTGRIVATHVTLIAGNTVTVDLTGDGLIRARVEDAALSASVSNSGSIEGTRITLSTGQAQSALDRVVNNSGVIRATGISIQDGEIILEGGNVTNTGTLDASSTVGKGGKVYVNAQDIDLTESSAINVAGKSGGGDISVMGHMQAGSVNVAGVLDASSSDGNGGFIETSAAHVNVADGTRVTTLAAKGHAGTWLIDPFDFIIAASGGDMTGATLAANLGSGNVSIQSTSGTSAGLGDIYVKDGVTWSANKLTLNAQNNIYINAAMNGSGTASLALEYGQSAIAAGNTRTYSINAPVNLPAGNNFSTKLGSNGTVKNYTVITSLGAAGSVTTTDLQGIKGGLAGNYALGGNIDASAASTWDTGAGFSMIGGASGNPFTGTFDGLGHAISNLTINRTGTNYVALFGYVAAGSAIRNTGLTGASISGQNTVGGLVGWLEGSVSNSYITGAVSGNVNIGGLVAVISGATLSNSYSSASISGSGNYIGGLVAFNSGTISNSYSTGSVTGPSVSVGGLLGTNNSGTISNSFWDMGSSGQTVSAGGTGLTSAQMKQLSSFSSWNTAQSNTVANTGGSGAVWRIYDGYTTPLLTGFLTGLTLADVSVAYSGGQQSGTSTVLAGVSGSAASGINEGTYSSGYYSGQQGYDISGGSLTITAARAAPARVTVTDALQAVTDARNLQGDGLSQKGIDDGGAIRGGTGANTGDARSDEQGTETGKPRGSRLICRAPA